MANLPDSQRWNFIAAVEALERHMSLAGIIVNDFMITRNPRRLKSRKSSELQISRHFQLLIRAFIGRSDNSLELLIDGHILEAKGSTASFFLRFLQQNEFDRLNSRQTSNWTDLLRHRLITIHSTVQSLKNLSDLLDQACATFP